MKKKLLLLLMFFLGMGGASGANHVFEFTTNQAKTNAWDWAINYKLATPLVNGKEYILTLKASTSDENFKNVSFWPYKDGGKTQYTGFAVDKNFTTRTVQFTAADDLDILVFDFGTLNGRLTFDDIKLVEKGTDENLVEDGDFENGTTLAAGWTFAYNKPNRYGIEEYDPAPNHYLKLEKAEATTNSWDRKLTYKLSTPLENGTTYILSMKSKSSCTWDYNSIPFWPYNSKEGGKTLYTGIGISTDWAEQTCEFTAEDAYDVIVFKLGKLAGDICFDNIKLVKKGSDENLVPGGSDFEGGNYPAGGWYPEIGYEQASYDFAQIVAGYQDFKATVISSDIDIRTSPWYVKEGESYVLKDNPTANGASYNVGTQTPAYYGAMWNGENLNVYADLTDYKSLRVYQNDATNVPRAFFFKADGSGHQQVTGFVWNEDGKYYEFDLALADKAVGNRKLTTLRATGNGTCTGLSLTKGGQTSGYVLTGDPINGNVTESATAALKDASNTYYDATGLTNPTPVALDVANPNAIIKAEAGKLTNEKNVAIDGTIAKLVLTDGNTFHAPEGVKAAEAKYTRTMTTKYGTVVLPFEATSTDVKFYEVKSMTNDAIVLQTVESLAAGTPAIIEKVTEKGDIVITGSGDVKNDINEAVKADGAVKMHGSYAQNNKVTDANAYYIKGDKFYSINDNFICNAFRGYFTTEAQAAAARLAIVFGDNATGINGVETQDANAIVAVYNAAGVKQQGMQQGVNIARLANGKTITVIVK